MKIKSQSTEIDLSEHLTANSFIYTLALYIYRNGGTIFHMTHDLGLTPDEEEYLRDVYKILQSNEDLTQPSIPSQMDMIFSDPN
jgi:hypothetical protein